MSFGKQMRLRREELHLSRAALAEELGVSPSAISNYENGVSSPKEEVLLRLFDALEIDPNYLYRDSFRSGSFVCARAERDLIEKCRSLSPLERETVGSLVSALCTMHTGREEASVLFRAARFLFLLRGSAAVPVSAACAAGKLRRTIAAACWQVQRTCQQNQDITRILLCQE